MNLSQTQVANFSTLAGLIVLVANQCGLMWEQSEVLFIMASLWSLGSTAYNYYQRFKKGDITLAGKRK